MEVVHWNIPFLGYKLLEVVKCSHAVKFDDFFLFFVFVDDCILSQVADLWSVVVVEDLFIS